MHHDSIINHDTPHTRAHETHEMPVLNGGSIVTNWWNETYTNETLCVSGEIHCLFYLLYIVRAYKLKKDTLLIEIVVKCGNDFSMHIY